MLTRMFITSKNKYNKKIENAIKKINKLTANPETSFKFDAERFKEIELFVYGQRPITYKPAWGLKLFWKDNLPTLRYHNPDIQFTVNNITVESESELSKLPLKLKVHGTDQSNSFEINCTDKPPSKILSELIEITKARKLTEEELPKLPLRPVK